MRHFGGITVRSPEGISEYQEKFPGILEDTHAENTEGTPVVISGGILRAFREGISGRTLEEIPKGIPEETPT